MGAKDRVEKILEDYNDVFADIYNTLVFKKSFLKKELLDFGPTESIYKSETGELTDQRRDVLKYYRGNGLLCDALEKAIEEKAKKSVQQERLDMVRRMLEQNYTKEAILALGFKEEEYEKVEAELAQMV